MKKNSLLTLIAISTLFIYGDCNKKDDGGQTNPPTATVNEVDFWLTKPDQTSLLQKQTSPLAFNTTNNGSLTIDVDSTVKYQSVDGFGYTLTGSSAYLIKRMGAAESAGLLNELFGAANNAINVSYLRISMGASDLSPSVFSYADMPAGQTDPTLANFSLSQDTVDLIPVLKQILTINPSIKIMGSPWSPPTWMKDNNNSIGGSLLPQYYAVYAQYFVK